MHSMFVTRPQLLQQLGTVRSEQKSFERDWLAAVTLPWIRALWLMPVDLEIEGSPGSN